MCTHKMHVAGTVRKLAHTKRMLVFLCCSLSGGHEVTLKIEVILFPFRHARTHVMKKLERKVVAKVRQIFLWSFRACFCARIARALKEK